MRAKAALLVGGLAALSWGQVPDTKVRLDILMHYRAPNGGQPLLRWYDTFGRSSVGILDMNLEPGYKLHVAQRLQKIPNNADADFLEEAFVEDRGLWRVGKQFLPFGSKNLIRESAYALQGETTFLLGGVPIVAAAFANGSGKAEGACGRVGGRIGASIAIGNFLAAQATSLTQLREPEKSPGIGRGYRSMVGLDASRRIGDINVSAEVVALRRGNTAADRDAIVSDLSFGYRTKGIGGYRLSWTRDWNSAQNAFIGRATLPVWAHLWIEPYARVRRSRISDAGVSLRLTF